MSLNRLQTHGFVPSPVRGQRAPDVSTPAGVKPQEIQAARTVQTSVDPSLLDAFLQARSGVLPKQRGLVPSMQALLGAPTSQPVSTEAYALQQKLGDAVKSLGSIYADGLVTEGELHHLHRARGQLHAVLGLAQPHVLQMLPKNVREKVENNLIEPLKVLVDAADRRAGRMFAALQARDEPALRLRLSEAPSYTHVDIASLHATGLKPFSLERYQPGDFIGVPRSDGSVDRGVVVGKSGGELQVELLDKRSGGLALKSLTAAEVAKANPLKIGDYLEAPGVKLWVTGTGPGGVVGRVQDARGSVRDVSADVVAKIAVEATAAHAIAASQHTQAAPRTSRHSLEQALDDVWAQRDAFKAGSKSVYGDIYNKVSDKNELTVSKTSMLESIADIAKGRPAGAVSNTQGFGGGGDAISSAVDMYKEGKLPAGEGRFSASGFEKTFFRFERENWQPHAIKQRVYINAAADHATDVMRHVVQQIVDNPQRFPGVEMAKLSGPGAVGGRSENIVIYTHGDEASKAVLAAVEQYRAQHPKHFMREVPAFTEQQGAGVATGDEPALKGHSFGSLRSDVIESAIHDARDRQHFGALVDERLKKNGIDPQRPHLNLSVHRGLS